MNDIFWPPETPISKKIEHHQFLLKRYRLGLRRAKKHGDRETVEVFDYLVHFETNALRTLRAKS